MEVVENPNIVDEQLALYRSGRARTNFDTVAEQSNAEVALAISDGNASSSMSFAPGHYDHEAVPSIANLTSTSDVQAADYNKEE